MYLGLRREGLSLAEILAPKFVLRMLAAVVLMGLIISVLTPDHPVWLEAGVFWRVARMTMVVTAGLASFVIVLAVSGLKLKALKDPSGR